MPTHIRLYEPSDLDPLKDLTVLAFEPVFASFRQIMGPNIFPKLYPKYRKPYYPCENPLFLTLGYFSADFLQTT